MISNLIVSLVLAVVIFSPSAFSADNLVVGQRSFTVMTYNLENFYDYTHDAGTEDYQYLPLAFKNSSEEVQAYCRSMSSGHYKERCFNMDWSQQVADQKIKNIGRVIRDSVSGGPDILIFEEVENSNVLEMLNKQELSDLGYREILLVNGPDPRGIDVAILSKFPLAQPVKYYDIDLTPAYQGQPKVKLTRGILAATLSIDGKLVTVLANHWPSQNNPDSTRVIAANVLIKAVKEAPGAVISAGDFNTEESDKPHAINEVILAKNAEVAFYDAEKVFYGEQKDDDTLTDISNLSLNRGTYFYKGNWSSLDRFFIPRAHVGEKCAKASGCLFPNWNDYRVVKFPYMVQDQTSRDRQGRTVVHHDVPVRYNDANGTGASDHLPVVMSFQIR